MTLKTCGRGHQFEKSSNCPTCPICWPKLKKNLLANSDLPSHLSAPALRAFDHAKIHSLTDVSKWSEKELLSLHGVGPKTITQLKPALKAKGLTFTTDK